MANRLAMAVILLGPIAALLALAAIFVAQIPYPAELNTFEGGLLDETWRVANGLPLYVAPSIDYVPFIYAPGLMWAGAALGKLIGVDLASLRLVSALGTILVLAAVFAVVRRRSDWRWGLLAAGLYAACFEISYGWYALGRVDNLALGLFCAGIWTLDRPRSDRHRWAAAVLFTAAIWTKQPMAIALLAVLVWAVIAERRMLGIATVTLIAAGLVPLLAWDRAAGSWVLFYTASLSAEQAGIDWLRLYRFFVTDLRPLGIVGLLVAAAAVLGVDRERRRDFGLALAAAIGLVALAWISRVFGAGWVNVLMPGFAALAGAGALAAHCCWQASINWRYGTLGRWVLTTALLLQFALLGYDPRRFIPESGATARLAQIKSQLASLPQPLWLAGDGYLLGGPAGAESLAITNLRFGTDRHDLAIERELRRRIGAGHYASVVLPDYAAEFWQPDLARRYRLAMKLGEGSPRLGLATTDIPGHPTWPYWVFVRN